MIRQNIRVLKRTYSITHKPVSTNVHQLIIGESMVGEFENVFQKPAFGGYRGHYMRGDGRLCEISMITEQYICSDDIISLPFVFNLNQIIDLLLVDFEVQITAVHFKKDM